MSARSAAIVGIGYTEITANSGRTTLRLAVEAAEAAMQDAGLTRDQVDGVVGFNLGDSARAMAVANELGLSRPGWTVDLNGGGHLACASVADAAALVNAGLADAVIVFRAMNGRSGRRLGGVGEAIDAAGPRQYLVPSGLLTYPQQMAMWCRRYFEQVGDIRAGLASVAVKSRANARDNERAQKREPLTLDQYYDGPMIVDPLRLNDICLESDGACAAIVTTAERAADLAKPPVYILGARHGGAPGPGTDLEDFIAYPDLTRNFGYSIRDELYGRAGVAVDDFDFAEIYDCFTHTLLLSLESMGIVPYGEAADYVCEPDTMLVGGRLPINTHGGLMSEGYLMGLNHVTEAVQQLRGEAGARQVAGAELGLVTAGAMMQGSALVLSSAESA